MASFFFIGGLPWYFKVIFGFFSDSIPLFKTRRYYYLVLSATFAGALWVTLGQVPITYSSRLLVVIGINTMLVTGSTVLGGLIAETGQKFGAAGRLASVRIFVEAAATVLAGPLSATLIKLPFSEATATAGAIAFAIVPIAIMTWSRKADRVRYNPSALENMRTEMRVLFCTPLVWGVALFMFFVMISQNMSSPLFCYQLKPLDLNLDKIAYLKAIFSVASLPASLAYLLISQRFSMKVLLVIGIVAAALSNLIYVFYDPQFAMEIYGLNGVLIVIHALGGFLSAFGILALMQMAIWATRTSASNMCFALFMSILNAGTSISDLLGATMFQEWSISLHNLAWIYATATALMICLLPLLPKELLDHRDGA